MSNDLPRVTTVHKSLGWARDFFSTSPVLVNRGKKILLGQETFLSTWKARRVRGQRGFIVKTTVPNQEGRGLRARWLG